MIRSREFSLGFVEVIHLLNKMSTVYDKTKKIWINLDENSLNSQEMSLGQQIFDSLTTYGSSIAQVCENTIKIFHFVCLFSFSVLMVQRSVTIQVFE